MHKTRNDLPLKVRTAVCKLLNERLADLLDLRLQAKQAHWNVKGPNFIGLHELFDSIHSVLAEPVDDVAERIVTLGGTAEGTVQIVGKRSSLAAYPVDISAGVDHVKTLADAIAATGKVVRKSIDEADELGDADTADLLTGISRVLDKHLWFVEAHIQSDK